LIEKYVNHKYVNRILTTKVTLLSSW